MNYFFHRAVTDVIYFSDGFLRFCRLEGESLQKKHRWFVIADMKIKTITQRPLSQFLFFFLGAFCALCDFVLNSSEFCIHSFGCGYDVLG